MGRCKLTGSEGAYVRSHLYPSAVTKRPTAKEGFIETGNLQRPFRSWTSWYDRKIVTKEGEDILSRLDTWGIEELRRHGLLWSGWDVRHQFEGYFGDNTGLDNWKVRTVSDANTKKLRLFFLSILWRWSVSDLPAAEEVTLSQKDTEILRDMILSEDGNALENFPLSIVQLRTVGDNHNQAPLRVVDDKPELQWFNHFRFYFDGLIVHCGTKTNDFERLENLGAAAIGGTNSFAVVSVPFESSYQKDNLQLVISESYSLWEKDFRKLAGTISNG